MSKPSVWKFKWTGPNRTALSDPSLTLLVLDGPKDAQSGDITSDMSRSRNSHLSVRCYPRKYAWMYLRHRKWSALVSDGLHTQVIVNVHLGVTNNRCGLQLWISFPGISGRTGKEKGLQEHGLALCSGSMTQLRFVTPGIAIWLNEQCFNFIKYL